MMDINKEYEDILSNKKQFRFTIKDKCEVTIFDFRKPIKKKKYRRTVYFFYAVRIHKSNGQIFPLGNHILQIPATTCWLQLYEFLEINKLLEEKNLKITIIRHSNHHYSFSTNDIVL